MAELFAWYNLIFVLPFIAAVAYTFASALGAASHGDHDIDHDIDHDVHHDFDHDHDLHHDLHHDVHHDVDHHLNLAEGFLSLLGFGKVPLAIVLQSFFLIWGFSGWASNRILSPILRIPVVYVWLSCGMALVSSVFLTGLIARLVSRIMPTTETYAPTKVSLVGKIGTAVFDISESSGTAQVHDDSGTIHQVSCRVKPQMPAIKKGSEVVVLSYHEDGDYYYVEEGLLSKKVEG